MYQYLQSEDTEVDQRLRDGIVEEIYRYATVKNM